MKNTTNALFTGLMAFSLTLPVFSEMRIWTDKTGKTIEAEHYRTLDDKVILKKADGSEVRVSLDTLTEKDRRYAILMTPPRVEISVSVDTDRENKGVGNSNRGPGYQVQQENVQAKVEVRKSSSAPYAAPLQSEVYLIGKSEQGEMYKVLDHSKSNFKFTTENKNTHSFESDSVSLKQLESGQQMGIEYEGYLAIVRDRTGQILEAKSSKLIFQRNADSIIGSKKNDVFDKEFNLVNKEQVKKEVQSRKEKVRKRVPGRNF